MDINLEQERQERLRRLDARTRVWDEWRKRSMTAFMAATGVRKSKSDIDRFQSWVRHPYGSSPNYQWPDGFDHSLVWVKERKFLITTEPYAWRERGESDAWEGQMRRVIASCEERSWSYHIMPSNVGMWNAVGRGGTRLVLVSPGPKGLDLEPLVRALTGDALPVWPDHIE